MTKIIVGGLYKKLSPWGGGNLNDQCYGLCLPVHNEDGTYTMLDTYQIHHYDSIDGSRTKGAIELAFKIASEDYEGWIARKARGDFYYKNQEKISDPNNVVGYELIADLHDWRPLKTSENAGDYKCEDILRFVRLFFEHGYPYGVTLIRKNAEKSPSRECIRYIADAYQELKYPKPPYKSTIEKINELVVSGVEIDEYQQERLERLIWLNNNLIEMENLIASYSSQGSKNE